MRGAAHEVLDDRKARRAAVQPRAAEQQRLGVRVARILEDLLGGALLADLAAAHHHHVIGDVTHHREIVGDEQHRHLVLALELGDEIQDLLLDRDVERGGGLVGDQQLRLARDRHRDHHALLLTSGHLRRVGVDAKRRIRNADLREQLDGALASGAPAQAQVQTQRLLELEADGEHRVERRHRLLEDHRDVAAAKRLQLGPAQADEVAPAVDDLAPGQHRRVLRRKQSEDRQRRHRLAAA